MRTTQELFDLTGRAALVTGGSRGLGLQMAEALGEQGARLVLAARKPEELELAVERLRARGIDASAIVADLSSEDGVQPLVEQALHRMGRIDILVNNAGASWGAPAEDYPMAAWDKVMGLNLRSVFLLAQAVAKLSMIPRRHGRIINISSIAGLAGNPPEIKSVAYNTSKAGVNNLTRALAAEWGPYGITVNALAPGFFPSKLSNGMLSKLGVDNMTKDVPLRRLGDDEDLKGPVLLLASDAGKHITGQVLAVDGGVSAVY